MGNTKLIAQAISWLRADDKFPRVDANDIVQELAVALEAAEAELTRRDTVIATVRAEAEQWRDSPVGEVAPTRAVGGLFLGILSAAPVSLEAVKAETTWEYGVTYVDPARPVSFSTSLDKAVESKAFYDGLIAANPSTYREQSPSMILRRTPGVAPGPWLPVSTEGDNRV